LFVSFGLGVGSTYSGTAGSWASASYESATGATSVVGTSGATFYITGVQLEVGSSATGFEYVNYQTSLANCQRYFQSFITTTYSYAGNTFSTTDARTTIPLLVSMRTVPTGITVVGTVQFCDAAGSGVSGPVFNNATTNQLSVKNSGGTGFAAAGGSSALSGNGTIQVSAEL
jgi:hypothetical protein